MTHGPSTPTCATCRFINYTREAGEQPRALKCSNPELSQHHEMSTALFADHSFYPPNLAFSCSRWRERAPDIGMVPVRLHLPPTDPTP